MNKNKLMKKDLTEGLNSLKGNFNINDEVNVITNVLTKYMPDMSWVDTFNRDDITYFINNSESKESLIESITNAFYSESGKAVLTEGILNHGKQKVYTSEELRNLEKELYDYLKENEIYPEDGTFENSDNNLYDLELDLLIDGDWKHDHLYTEHLVDNFCKQKGLGIIRHDVEEVGDSDDDWYKGWHYWKIDTAGDNAEELLNAFRTFFGEDLNEDTVKQGKYWVNKGKEGTHGKFKTKKAADAQRKAMFARGYTEDLKDDKSVLNLGADGFAYIVSNDKDYDNNDSFEFKYKAKTDTGNKYKVYTNTLSGDNYAVKIDEFLKEAKLDKSKIKFETFGDLKDYTDSLLFDEPETIARLEYGDYTVVVDVAGEKKIYFNDAVYRYASDYPNELVDIIKSGKIYDYDADVAYLEDNNWFDIVIYKDNEYVDDQVFEYDLCNLSEEQLKSIMEDYLLLELDESLKEAKERKYIKTRNSCVDAADLADELEEQDIKYEFEDDGLSVDAKDYDRAINILYDLEANCDESLKEENTPTDMKSRLDAFVNKDKNESIKESMETEVNSWWEEVEKSNKDNNWGFNIDNTDSTVEEKHSAMFDMIGSLKGKDDDLFKKGKKIYNKYAKYSKYNESLKELYQAKIHCTDGSDSYGLELYDLPSNNEEEIKDYAIEKGAYKEDQRDDLEVYDIKLQESLKEGVSTEEELEKLPKVYLAFKNNDDSYRLKTSWVKSTKQAHNNYLSIDKALKDKYGEDGYKLTYVRNEWRDNQKEVQCVLDVKILDETKNNESLKEGKLSDLRQNLDSQVVSQNEKDAYYDQKNKIVDTIQKELGLNGWNDIKAKFTELGGDLSAVKHSDEILDFIYDKCCVNLKEDIQEIGRSEEGEIILKDGKIEFEPKNEEEPKLETFEDKMDFLAKDEQEAIDGYDKIIAMLSEEDANVKEQLEKIRVEEQAHKDFLEKVKTDKSAVYTEPLEQEEFKEIIGEDFDKKVKTPRGEFRLIDKTEDELRKDGYGLHHTDGNIKVFTKDNKAVAIKVEKSLKESTDNLCTLYLVRDTESGKVGQYVEYDCEEIDEEDFIELLSEIKDVVGIYGSCTNTGPINPKWEKESVTECNDKNNKGDK